MMTSDFDRTVSPRAVLCIRPSSRNTFPISTGCGFTNRFVSRRAVSEHSSDE